MLNRSGEIGLNQFINYDSNFPRKLGLVADVPAQAMFLSPKLQPEWKRQLANLKEPRAANIVYVRRVVLSPHTRSAVFPALLPARRGPVSENLPVRCRV